MDPKRSSDPSVIALKCNAEELIFVMTRNQVRLRPGVLTVGVPRSWAWTLALGEPAMTCTLQQDVGLPGAVLTCREGLRNDIFHLQQVGDGARIAELDAALTRGRPTNDVCARAERCCAKAFALLSPGTPCNADFELGKPRVTEQCQNALNGLRMMLDIKKHPIPGECL